MNYAAYPPYQLKSLSKAFFHASSRAIKKSNDKVNGKRTLRTRQKSETFPGNFNSFKLPPDSSKEEHFSFPHRNLRYFLYVSKPWCFIRFKHSMCSIKAIFDFPNFQKKIVCLYTYSITHFFFRDPHQ